MLGEVLFLMITPSEYTVWNSPFLYIIPMDGFGSVYSPVWISRHDLTPVKVTPLTFSMVQRRSVLLETPFWKPQLVPIHTPLIPTFLGPDFVSACATPIGRKVSIIAAMAANSFFMSIM